MFKKNLKIYHPLPPIDGILLFNIDVCKKLCVHDIDIVISLLLVGGMKVRKTKHKKHSYMDIVQ
jgi:hypothetical protein